MSRAQAPAGHRVPTSPRARWCLGVLVAGDLVFAVLAGAPNSPLTTPLPAGAQPPSWATGLASSLGLRHLGRPEIVVAALAVVVGMLGAFGFLLAEAHGNRVRAGAVLASAAICLAISAAAPLLLSRDAISYLSYARVATEHHRDPYLIAPAAFRSDPFVAVTSAQWLHVRAPYGPALILVGEGVARAWPRSPGAAILAFKLLAALGVGVATASAATVARAVRPGRTALTTAAVGLNPVVLIHTVGGGHADALIAGALAGALALAVGGRGARSRWGRTLGVTALLTLASLVRVVVAPVLILWLWWVLSGARSRGRIRQAAAHLGVVAILWAGLWAPFVTGWRAFASVPNQTGIEAWASPAHLIARGAHALVGGPLGPQAGRIAEDVILALFLALFAILFARAIPRRSPPRRSDDGASALAGAWGTVTLLLALSLACLLPWYAVWFAPFLGILEDGTLIAIGAVATGVLALTLIPADPAHGLSTWGVMLGVHYAAAPVLLALFVIAGVRLLTEPLPVAVSAPRRGLPAPVGQGQAVDAVGAAHGRGSRPDPGERPGVRRSGHRLKPAHGDMPEARTIVFFPEGAFGPTNNCMGIGQVLRRRGHRVVFVVEESFAGTLEARGFEEARMRLGPPPEVEEAPGQFWKDFIRETAPEFRKPTIEQLSTFLQPTWQALIDGSRYANARLEEIFDQLRPDAIVEDNVVAFPAVAASGRPWVRIVSCNPLEVRDAELPPPYSGLPANDRTGWDAFRAEFDRTHRPMWEAFDTFVRQAGAPPLPDVEFMHASPWLNLYVYPSEVDYARSRPLDPTWHAVGSSVREPEPGFAWPPGFEPGGDRPLVYLSLGSLGSADVELMKRLLEALAEAPYRLIVSKGPQAKLFELPPNAWGDEVVPQPAILPGVDLVITHGGNNTTTEALHFGKPTVVLPLFWDQYDNAQRLDERGLGVRLDTYRCSRAELGAAIDRMLADAEAGARLRALAARLQSDPGVVRAADLIERVAAAGTPVGR